METLRDYISLFGEDLTEVLTFLLATTVVFVLLALVAS